MDKPTTAEIRLLMTSKLFAHEPTVQDTHMLILLDRLEAAEATLAAIGELQKYAASTVTGRATTNITYVVIHSELQELLKEHKT